MVVAVVFAAAWAESSSSRLWSFEGSAMVTTCPSGRGRSRSGGGSACRCCLPVLLFTHSREARGTKTVGMQVTAPGWLAGWRSSCGERCNLQEALRSWALQSWAPLVTVSKRTSKPPPPPFFLHTSGVFRFASGSTLVMALFAMSISLHIMLSIYLFILLARFVPYEPSRSVDIAISWYDYPTCARRPVRKAQFESLLDSKHHPDATNTISSIIIHA